jgi:hypothetical protein
MKNRSFNTNQWQRLLEIQKLELDLLEEKIKKK